MKLIIKISEHGENIETCSNSLWGFVDCGSERRSGVSLRSGRCEVWGCEDVRCEADVGWFPGVFVCRICNKHWEVSWRAAPLIYGRRDTHRRRRQRCGWRGASSQPHTHNAQWWCAPSSSPILTYRWHFMMGLCTCSNILYITTLLIIIIHF